MSSVPFIFDAIGTQWQIDINQKISEEKRDHLLFLIKERIEIFDKDYSRFRKDSLVTEMSKLAGTYILPCDAQPMFDLYQDLYKETRGQLTPLIGQVLVDAGYDAEYSLEEKTLTVPPEWDEALEYNFPNLVLKKPALLDLGAIGKGYLIDIVAEIILSQDITEFCIDAGGDILHRGKELLKVGLEDPEDASKVIGVAQIKDQSICGSAGNRRAWGRFHHIIHPKTLSSPRHILSVWVVASTTILADAIATALFFVSPESLLFSYSFEYLIINNDSGVQMSRGFNVDLFT